ncbi:MAG: class I SAM-dependent methyltransferase [Candidatus Nanopelagicales bacterium]
MTATPDPEALGPVRDALAAAGYTVDGALEALGPTAYAALGRGETVPASVVLSNPSTVTDPGTRTGTGGGTGDAGAGGTACGTLLRLFVLGEQVPRRQVERALPVDAARELGLVEVDGAAPDDGVRAALDVRPYGEADVDWWVVSDLGPDRLPPGQSLPPDHVLGVGGASVTLAQITPRLPVATALDLGTGCGVQALHLTRHAQHVVGTDTNARALDLAALTAGLSGVTWESRRGSLFDPVDGARFDLVVSNPPFVVSPGPRYEYRDAGLPGDELGRTLLARAPRHLADDGWCVVLANWLHVEGQDWRDRVASWVDGSGCDAWVVHRDLQDPAEYAELWLRDAGDHARPQADALYADWLAALRAMRAEAVGFGWVVLHAAGRDVPWVEVEDLAEAPRLPRGGEVVDQVAAYDDLAALDAGTLLTAAPAWAAGTRVLEETVVLDDGVTGLPPRVARVDGWRPPERLDPRALAVLRPADGTRTLDALVDAEAAASGSDRLDLLAVTLPAARALLRSGALRPPSRSAGQ